MREEDAKEWYGILRIDATDKIAYLVRGDLVLRMDVDEDFMTRYQVGDEIYLKPSLLRVVY